ncbi:MAG: bifunctional phosphoglucose/phosphomannose isomerase [Candidatus Thorarchaeota archaeon]
MRSMVEGFPLMLKAGRLDKTTLEEAEHNRQKGIDGICLVGMGGSAIAGEICAAYLSDRSAIPVVTFQGYTLPPFVNERWAVIAVSYSGDTDETLSAFESAQSRGCPTFTFTTGGDLEKQAKGTPIQKLTTGFQPRAALPLILSGILPLLEIILNLQRTDLESAATDLERMSKDWENMPFTPKQLAKDAMGKIPLFVGWKHLTPVAYRARCQMNENAKVMAFNSELPEASHNEIEGTASCGEFPLLPVFLRSTEEDQKTRNRFEATLEIFSKNGCNPMNLELGLRSRIQESLGFTFFLDLVSIELAELRDVDPLEVKRITELKKKLRKTT